MSGLMPSDDEDEYGNIIRRAPVNYPSRLMNRSMYPEPDAPKGYNLKPLGFDEGMRRKSPDQLERERKEAIADRFRAEEERAKENEASRIARVEQDSQGCGGEGSWAEVYRRNMIKGAQRSE
ncbi:hypothetical protein NHQ30_009126 [Ciborinia camelliae]|nr:hypothetical protein NHQ30_009126 [Ciborinia camelliae]